MPGKLYKRFTLEDREAEMMRVTNPFFIYLFTLSTSKTSKLKSNALLDSLTEKCLAAFSTLY